jgi:IS30 family transposase
MNNKGVRTTPLREKILKLRSEGWAVRKIARNLGICESTAWYHVSPNYRRGVRRRVEKWNKTHPEQYAERKHKYQQSDRFKRIVCLSLIKTNLKYGRVFISDLEKIIKEHEDGTLWQ